MTQSGSEADLKRRLDSVTGELLSAYEELDVLTTVAEIAASTPDIQRVGRRILEEAAVLLSANVSFLIYVDPRLKEEEPRPDGITEAERDALAGVLKPWLAGSPRPEVMAPFHQGAGIPHAPEALLAVPLRAEGEVLGALCLGRRGEGQAFTAGDLKILSVLGSSAASALLQRRNLDLTRMARRLEDRNTLLKGILVISREIAASLDLDRLLHAMANLPSRVLGFDRCSVLLDEGGSRRLRAVSGLSRVDRGDVETKSLETLAEWCAGRGARVMVQTMDGKEPGDPDGALCEPPDATVLALPHMRLAGARSFLALPLQDTQGLLGILSLESAAAGFMDESRLEGATILANQATVALRNARLYSDVPFVGILAPLRRGLRRAQAAPGRRVAAWVAAGAALLFVLVVGRWDLRVPARVTVMPQKVALVSARVRGVVREVGPWREGDRIERGAVLARLEAPDLELRHAEAASKMEAASRTVARLAAEGRAAEVQVARAEAGRWAVETAALHERLEESVMRAPIDGVLMTPRLAERAGELLDVGGILCTIAQMDPLRVEIAVPEHNADVLTGAAGVQAHVAALKFAAYPAADFTARLTKVRQAAEMVEGTRALVVEGIVEMSKGSASTLRPGMTGQARVVVGSRPLIVILFRRSWRFVRGLIWL